MVVFWPTLLFLSVSCLSLLAIGELDYFTRDSGTGTDSIDLGLAPEDRE